MILGVGIDYSIHIMHRHARRAAAASTPGLLETGKAVVLAALTNIAGFGTLWLGNYPALRSFGQVALIGSATCLLTALTLVPAILGTVEPDPAPRRKQATDRADAVDRARPRTRRGADRVPARLVHRAPDPGLERARVRRGAAPRCSRSSSSSARSWPSSGSTARASSPWRATSAVAPTRERSSGGSSSRSCPPRSPVSSCTTRSLRTCSARAPWRSRSSPARSLIFVVEALPLRARTAGRGAHRLGAGRSASVSPSASRCGPASRARRRRSSAG